MSEHTPEPWTIVGKFSDKIYHEGSDTVVAQAWYPGAAHNLPSPADTMIANARRIVACVNACAGMVDPAAEIARLRADNDELDEVCTRRQLEIYKLEAEIAKLRTKREELIEAGNAMRSFILEWRDCLEGVQMSEEDFASGCGIGKWNRAALAEKGE